MSVGIAPAITVEPVREPRSFAPPSLSARFLPLGRIPFGFGTRFFVALAVGLVWTVPAWWAPQFIDALYLWDGIVIFAFLIDWMHLPRPRQLEGFRSWEHAPSLAADSDIAVGVENFTGTPIRCTLT
ncbi:MAG: hypothetical protein WA823_11665, partial [Candidatus Acidiferrales bacterium]